jgi:hypothetical protein
MLFEAVFIVCMLMPTNPWIGDHDTGPTCAVYERASFAKLDQCLTRLADNLKVASTKEEQERIALQVQIPGPYDFRSLCKVEVDYGPLPCNDCEE